MITSIRQLPPWIILIIFLIFSAEIIDASEQQSIGERAELASSLFAPTMFNAGKF